MADVFENADVGVTAPITANATLLMGKINRFDADAAARVGTLPPLSGLRVGAWTAVQKIDATANTVTPTCTAGDTFADGTTSASPLCAKDQQREYRVVSIGSSKFWKATGAYDPPATAVGQALTVAADEDSARSAIYAAPKIADAGSFPWPQGLVALWDFQRDKAGGSTVTSRVGAQSSVLAALGGKAVVKDAADPGPFGPSLVLDGATAFVKSGGLGALDVSQTGDQVTVINWVRDTGSHDDTFTGIAFRAGSHCETSSAPARQYASYFDANYVTWSCARFAPHIGAQDDATPGYQYNVDFASTARQYFTGTGGSQWHMEAFTFDGAQIVAYVDGMSDSFKNAVEQPPPTGSGYTAARVVDRNPYPLRKGINRSQTTKRFSIGGSTQFSGGAVNSLNYTTGKLGGVAVFNRALTPAEIMQVRLATLMSGEPITMFGFEVSSTGGHSLNEIGWAAGAGATNVHVGALNTTGPEYAISRPAGGTKSYLTKTSTAIGATWGPVTGLNSSQVARVRFKMLSAATTAAAQRVLVKVGSQWWASNATFATSSAHASDTDWSGAESKVLALNWDVGNWRAVTIADTGSTATYQNLVKNPALINNANNWFKSGLGSPNATAARFDTGSGFTYRFTWTGTDLNNQIIGGYNSSGVAAMTAGTLYSASAVFTSSKPQKLQLQLVWVDAGSTQFATTTGGTFTVGKNTPTTVSVSAVAPAGAVAAVIRVQSLGGVPGTTAWFAGDTLDMSKALLVAGLPVGYFDGTSPLAAWDGTVGSSTSTITNTPAGVLSLSGATNSAYIDNALLTAIGFLSSGGDGSAVRVTDLELLPN